jgi:hypothetical protein
MISMLANADAATVLCQLLSGRSATLVGARTLLAIKHGGISCEQMLLKPMEGDAHAVVSVSMNSWPLIISMAAVNNIAKPTNSHPGINCISGLKGITIQQAFGYFATTAIWP